MKRFLPLFALAALPLLAGCHKDSIAGKWQGTTPGPQGSSVTLVYNFTDDGKETMDVTMAGGPVPFSVSTAGTYKIDGKNLTQTVTSMTFSGRSITVPPDKTTPKTAAFTLDGDHLTITNPQSQQPMTLTRVKS